ncbi:hypothetical protein CBR_g24061 [Chara braunii]|uniref:Uncharacterized protein n=1 Tax=Chara braunii TaxID=69332 RepID=A0A388L5N8_CHABU|nr:hypothetical protein CBR_g24061 [Chara braunii]|eukprot:GBG77615.1 hypothetical protein CBR_g24061 [Chara braunii]
MSESPLLRRAQVYTAPWLGGASGMRGTRGGLSTTLAGKVSVVAVEGDSVRAPRGGMTVQAAAQTPTSAQNSRALLSGKDTARRNKALREVLLRDLGGRRASVTRAAACPGKGGEDKLEALSHRESRVLQVVLDGIAEVEVIAMITRWRQRGTSVLLTILDRAEAAREVATLLRGTAGATAERRTALGSAMRGGGVTRALRLGGGGGVKTDSHLLMVPGGLASLRGQCELRTDTEGELLGILFGKVRDGHVEPITSEVLVFLAQLLDDLPLNIISRCNERPTPATLTRTLVPHLLWSTSTEFDRDNSYYPSSGHYLVIDVTDLTLWDLITRRVEAEEEVNEEEEEREEVSKEEEENSGAESEDLHYHESEEGELEGSDSGGSDSSNGRSEEEDEAAAQKRRERAKGKWPVEDSDEPVAWLLQSDPARNPESPQEEPGEDCVTTAEGYRSRRCRRSPSPTQSSPPPRPTVRIRGDAGA